MFKVFKLLSSFFTLFSPFLCIAVETGRGIVIFRRFVNNNATTVKYLLFETMDGNERQWISFYYEYRTRTHIDEVGIIRELFKRTGIRYDAIEFMQNFVGTVVESSIGDRRQKKTILYRLAELTDPNTAVQTLSHYYDYKWATLAEVRVLMSLPEQYDILNICNKHLIKMNIISEEE